LRNALILTLSTATWHLPRVQVFVLLYLLCYANYAMSTKKLEISKFFCTFGFSHRSWPTTPDLEPIGITFP